LGVFGLLSLVERWLSFMASLGSYDFFKELWEDIDSEIDAATFSTKVYETVAPVMLAWRESEFDVEHPGSEST